MSIRAYVSDNFAAIGLNISIVQDHGNGDRYVRRFDPNKNTWEYIENPQIVTAPSMEISHEEAIALLNALHEHFKGPTDARQCREDLEFERERSGQMLSSILKQHDATTHRIDAGS
jgi:hypothetical protein